MNTIKEIADYYEIPVADTIKPFRDHPEGYDALVKDGTHPNDKGYEVFAQAVEGVLDDQVRAEALPTEAKTEPRNEAVSFFANATWIPVKKFSRKGLAFTTKISSDIVGSGQKNFLSDGTLTLEFETKDQADSFKGCGGYRILREWFICQSIKNVIKK